MWLGMHDPAPPLAPHAPTHTRRYSNSSGTQMWPWEGGYPDGTMSTLSSTYYGSLWKHMESNYGYRRGVDMFATPWDWRWDFDGLNQARGCVAGVCALPEGSGHNAEG